MKIKKIINLLICLVISFIISLFVSSLNNKVMALVEGHWPDDYSSAIALYQKEVQDITKADFNTIVNVRDNDSALLDYLQGAAYLGWDEYYNFDAQSVLKRYNHLNPVNGNFPVDAYSGTARSPSTGKGVYANSVSMPGQVCAKPQQHVSHQYGAIECILDVKADGSVTVHKWVNSTNSYGVRTYPYNANDKFIKYAQMMAYAAYKSIEANETYEPVGNVDLHSKYKHLMTYHIMSGDWDAFTDHQVPSYLQPKVENSDAHRSSTSPSSLAWDEAEKAIQSETDAYVGRFIIIWGQADGQNTMVYGGKKVSKPKPPVQYIGKIKIVKKDDLGNYLQGVKFKITSAAGNSMYRFTDVDGEILLEKLPLNAVYTIEEEEAPAGYTKASPSSQKVTATTNASVTFTNKKERGSLKVLKVDADKYDAKRPAALSGVQFVLRTDRWKIYENYGEQWYKII